MSIYNEYESRYTKLNSDNIELYKFRFGRLPRERSLEDIQLIWINSIKRTQERRLRISSIINKIIEEIPSDKCGNKIVYYKSNNQVHTFTFSNYYPGNWGYSKGKLIFSEDKSTSRDEKIDIIINNDRAFELGEEMKESLIWETKYSSIVGDIFTKMIENRLKKYYKCNKNIPDISVVKIGDIKYYFSTHRQNGFGIPLRFKFVCEVTNEIIDI